MNNNPDAPKPLNNNLYVAEAEQGVKQKPRIFVVEESQSLAGKLRQDYATRPEEFHGCELVFADRADVRANTHFVLDPSNKISMVLTGLGTQNSSYGLELAKALKKSHIPVAITSLGEPDGVQPFSEIEKEQLTEMQKKCKEAGAIGLFAKGDMSVFKTMADGIGERQAMHRIP